MNKSTFYITQLLWFVLLPVQFSGCVSTPNYYTGKTLPEGEKVITAGVDNIHLKGIVSDIGFGQNSDDIKRSPFTPSFGFAMGLPNRFETGIRYIPINTIEGLLRWEATPESFNHFDFSINNHFIYFIPFVAYSKYGVTLSKDINTYQPFVNYYRYLHLFSMEKGTTGIKDWFSNFRTVGLGIAIPIPGGSLIPEMNYQYENDDFSDGILFINVGFRVTLE